MTVYTCFKKGWWWVGERCVTSDVEWVRQWDTPEKHGKTLWTRIWM